MNKDLQAMYLKQLVNDKQCYEEFQQHIDDLIKVRQSALEAAHEPHIMYRQQGAIDTLKKLKLLRETLNSG